MKKEKWIGALVGLLLLTCIARGDGLERKELRDILEGVVSTEYCGTAAEQGFGTTTAIRGLSPVQGRGFVHIEEADWGPILLEMAAEELTRCGEATRGALDTIRTESAILERGRRNGMPEDEQDQHCKAIADANNEVQFAIARLPRMLALLRQMESEREGVLRMIGRIARECPPEYNINREANGAWICQTLKTDDVGECLELGKWYRAEKGKGSNEEIDFCRQLVNALPDCKTEESYRQAARYVLEAMEDCGNYPQCNGFDMFASKQLRGWVGSRQRKRMAGRFLDWRPHRYSYNLKTGERTEEPPTPEDIAAMFTTRAAAELAADEEDLTDLREVYGEW